MTKISERHRHSSGERPSAALEQHGRGQEPAIRNALVFLSALICCSSGLLAAAAAAAQSVESQSHDSISSDSSSSQQGAVSNLLAMRSHQPQLLKLQPQSQAHLRHQRSSERQQPAAREEKHAFGVAAAAAAQTERADLLSSSASVDGLNEPTMDSDEASQPAATAAAAAASGEGPLNGDESANEDDYETTESSGGGGDSSSAEAEAEAAAADNDEPAESHVRPSRQSAPATTRRPQEPIATTTTGNSNQLPLAAAATTTTTTPAPPDFRGRQVQFVSLSRGGGGPNAVASEPPTTVNVNMGSDRLLIKPHHENRQALVTTTTGLPPPATSTFRAGLSSIRASQEPRASESVNHELFAASTRSDSNLPLVAATSSSSRSSSSGSRLAPTDDNQPPPPPATTFSPGSGQIGANYATSSNELLRLLPNGDQQQQQQQQHQVQPSICYTPLALLLVVLMAVTITLAVCFCVQLLVKHFNRRSRFDLVASSRQFDKHSNLDQQQQQHWPPLDRQQQQQQQQQLQLQSAGKASSAANLLSGLFPIGAQQRSDGARSASRSRLDRGQQRDDEFAFDNPYFRAEQLRQQQQLPQLQSVAQDEGAADEELSAVRGNQQQQLEAEVAAAAATAAAAAATTTTPAGNEQLHFIQHHISNLHNRQVTSSVRELSALAAESGCAGRDENRHPPPPPPLAVVDLTSDEQRQRIIADPKEGDLIAVDITGHDFIGLGFDVCGNPNDGIFVKSVLARGPARESGCIEPGDRIKCLNLSFDNITLQDAADILNCGAPYKMRILLEKRAMLAGGRSAGIDTAAAAAAANKHRPIRACLKKLGSLVGGGAGCFDSPSAHYGGHLSELSTGGADDDDDNETSWLGSAAARGKQQQQRQRNPLPGGQVNLAYGASDSELATASGPTRAQQQQQQQQQLSTGTIGSSSCCSEQLARSGRLSIDSGNEIFRSSQPTVGADGAGLDSSLELRAQNANHRLHGPPAGQHRHRHQLIGDCLNLASRQPGDTTDDDDDDDDGDHHHRHDHHDHEGRHNTRGGGGRHRQLRQLSLEQSQSQPEIVARLGSAAALGANTSELLHHHGRRFNVDHADDTTMRSQQVRAQLMATNSISTPTMNLLPNQATGSDTTATAATAADGQPADERAADRCSSAEQDLSASTRMSECPGEPVSSPEMSQHEQSEEQQQQQPPSNHRHENNKAHI